MEHPYLDLLRDVLLNGYEKQNRTGVPTRSLFGRQIRFDLTKGFPLLTTKKVHFKSLVHELLWFLQGNTNIEYLKAHNVRIWDEWADEHGSLGPIYGAQWRRWPTGRDVPTKDKDGHTWFLPETIDQISWVINEIRNNPDSRRLVVSAWNVAQLDKMALAPCHCLFQFYVIGGYLHCQLYQRSADVFLGVPFNIASYALLTHMIAQVTGLTAGDFVHTFGDVHLYENHVEQAREQLSRQPKSLPGLFLNPTITDIFDFKFEDISVDGYDPWPAIKAEVAV